MHPIYASFPSRFAGFSSFQLPKIEAATPKMVVALFALAAFSLLPRLAFSLDYYWVNGSGIWSDFANHWATSPAGTTFHANVPTASDDVFFTDNGGVAYEVFVNAASTVPKCRNMDWSGAPNGTVWHGDGTGRIDIYGSLLLDAGMSITFPGQVHFIAFGSASTITSNGVHFYACSLFFEGTAGGWMLNDALFVDGIVGHEGGTLLTNDKTVSVGGFYGNSPGMLELGDSDFNVTLYNANFGYAPAGFDAGTSHVICHASAISGAYNYSTTSHFYDVTFTQFNPAGFYYGSVDGTLKFEGNATLHGYNVSETPLLNHVIFQNNGLIFNDFSYNHLTLSAGKTYTFQNAFGGSTTQTLLPGGSLTANGGTTCNDFITLRSWQFGTPINLANNTGSNFTLDGLILQDIHATGTHSLTDNSGINLGNNTGWNFTNPCPGLNLFWIGGGGDWDDPAHWSTASGGASCNCTPTPTTNVVFDANSNFTPGSQVVYLPVEAYCADMTWTGVTGTPIFQSSGVDLYVYGSLTLASTANMAANFAAIRLRAGGAATIFTGGQHLSRVIFEGAGSWTFLDGFSANEVFHVDGTIFTQGNDIATNSIWRGNFTYPLTANANQGAELWLGTPGGASSTWYNVGFDCGYQTGLFHCVESELVTLSGYSVSGSTNHDFWKVTFPFIFDNGYGYFSGNILDKLTFGGTGTGLLAGSNSYLHEVEFQSEGTISGNHSFDILTLTGGHAYYLTDVQTISAAGSLNFLDASCEKRVYLRGFGKIGKASGSLSVSHAIFDDVSPDLSTPATYSATNCVAFQPQVATDWNMTNPAGRDLFWVGGTGDWNDDAHWSLTSNGAGGECPPTHFDDVFFDANSGLGAADTVVGYQTWNFCKDMDWTGAEGILDNGLQPSNQEQRNQNMVVFGSLTFATGMVNDFNGIFWMKANQPATLTSHGKHFKSNLHFDHPNGDWTLSDDLFVERTLHHIAGKLTTNNHDVAIGFGWYNPGSPDPELFLGSSTITMLGSVGASYGYFFYTPEKFHSGTSSIVFEPTYSSQLYASPSVEFFNLTFKGTISYLQGGSVKNKLIFEKTGTIHYGGNVHDAEFHDDFTFYDSRNYHKIKFFPGKRYTFQATSVQTIVPFNGQQGQFIAQGLPGQYIEMKSSSFSNNAYIYQDDSDGTSTCTKYLFMTAMTHTGSEDIYVPTPGGNVFGSTGWQFLPCNPCPASVPELELPGSVFIICPPANASLKLDDLKVDEWAIWYDDPAATNEVYNGGPSVPGDNLFEPLVTVPITYYARVYSDGGLCRSQAILTVNVTTPPPPTVFNLTGGGAVCLGSNGAPVGLSGSENGVGYQLQLDGVDIGPVHSAGSGVPIDFGNFTTAGTYTVRAFRFASNCVSTMNGTAIVTGSPLEAPAVAPISNAPLPDCMGTLQLDELGGDGVSWAWSGPNNFASSLQNPTLTVVPMGTDFSGEYEVFVTDAQGCFNTGFLTVSPVYTDAVPPEALCKNVMVELDDQGMASITADQIDDGSFDVCSPVTLEASLLEFNCDDLGDNEVSLQVTDASGNPDACSALVTVVDNIAPVANCETVVMVELDENGEGGLTGSQVDMASTDNCSIVAYSLSQDGFNCEDLGLQLTVTLTVEDASGHTATCQTLVTVQDPVPPTVACANFTAYLDASGNASVTVADVLAGESDNCFIVSRSVSPNTFNCTQTGMNTVELIVTDTSGLTGNCFAVVTVEDNLQPTTACQDTVLYLDDLGIVLLPAFLIETSSSDNCGLAGISVSPNGFDCTNVGENTVTLTVIDFAGLTGTCNANVTVLDTIPPLALCQNVVATLDPDGEATITASQVNNSSVDNCGIVSMSLSPTVFSCANAGANAATLTVEDASGNTHACSAGVSIIDEIPPTAACKAATIWLDANGTGILSPSQVDDGSLDNCGLVTLSVSQDTFTCLAVGANSVTLTAADAGNLTHTCQAIVTVQDTISPVALCKNIAVELNSSGEASISQTALDDGSHDNCGIGLMSVSRSNFTCADLGANTVTLQVVDVNLNLDACTGTVSVVDLVPPVALCQGVTVQLNSLGTASISTTDVDDGSSDNCTLAGLSLSQTAFTCADLGTKTVHLFAADQGGLTDTCQVTVTVQDLLPPTALCKNATVSLGANGTVTLDPASVDNGSSDNCGIVSRSVSPSVFNCSQIDGHLVTLTVADASNLSHTCQAIVTVQDDLPPAANCKNVTVQLDANGQASISTADVDDNSTDNCGIFSRSVSPTNFTCANGGANSVTLTVTDVNSLVSTCSATVTVTDGIAPTAICEPTLTVALGANGQASLTTGQVDDGSFDNCGGVSLSLSLPNLTCANLGTSQVTLTVSDGSLSATCQTSLTVQDNILPVARCKNATISLDANGQASLAPGLVDDGSSDNCGVSLSVNPSQFACTNVGSNQVTLTATDPAGLASTCMATVTVQDNLPPTALCQPITVALDAGGQASISAAQIDDGSSDNCGISSLSLSQIQFTCTHRGLQTVTLTAADVHNLTATCTALVTVVDNLPPTALCQPATVVLDANGSATATAAQVDAGSSDNCGIVSRTISPTNFDCQDVGNQPVVLTVTDVAGLVSTCQTTLTVEDNQAPALACQNLTVALDVSGELSISPFQVLASMSDNCAADLDLSLSQTEFTCFNVGENTVTLTVTDPGGNSASCTAIVTVEPFLLLLDIVVTDESCPSTGDGTITITAGTASGNYQILYSISGGAWWNLTGEFEFLDEGWYDVVVRLQGSSYCDVIGDAYVGIAATPPTWYKDVDEDDYSDGVNVTACFASPEYYLPEDLIATSGDCNDYDPLEMPGQTWHRDWDGDGYSNGLTLTQCDRPWGYEHETLLTATSGDCNDNIGGINPAATEVCNSLDDDCDGDVDEGLSNLVFTGNVTLENQAQVNAWSLCWSVIEGNLTIQNATIDSLSTLVNLVKVTGNVTIELTMLDSLSWLMSLDSIGGDLKINTNDTLVTLHGLDSLLSVGGDVLVFYNFDLDSCCAIYELINEENGRHVGGSISIVSNDLNCDNVQAINDFCDGNTFAPPGETSDGAATATTETPAERQFFAFPNPAKDRLTLRWTGTGLRTGELQVVDLWGQTVLKTELAASRMEQEISVAGLPDGLYFFKILEAGEVVWMEKIVRQ